ncbi:MAG: HEAT repeat domain-containing protein, partial [Chloroflexi bacterium]|nr:HEAT repeat domain-containing protein [Chloroflexota bacterium]
MSILLRLFGPSIEKMETTSNVDELIAALNCHEAIFASDEKLADGRAAAARRLGELKDPHAVEPLIAALYATERVRKAAADALGQIGAPAVKPLSGMLNPDYSASHHRKTAVETLAKIGVPAAEALIIALKDKDRSVHEIAAEALVKIGTPAIEPLIATLKDYNKPHMRVPYAAAEVLEQIGWQPGRDEIGATYWTVKGAWGKCVAIGAPAVEPLFAALKRGNKDAAGALGDIGAPAVEP